MKRLLILLVALGVLFGIGIGLHAGLVSVASGDGAWSERAGSVCGACHGD